MKSNVKIMANEVKDLSFKLAIRIVMFCKYLTEEKKDENTR